MTTDQQTLIQRVRNSSSHEKLRNLEVNITEHGAMTPEIEAEVKAQYGMLARQVVADKAGIDLSDLSPAEEKIVMANAEYVALMKRAGKPTSRTFQQLKNRGLRGAAEAAVSKEKATLGFTVLNDANRRELSYEQIIVDHPAEFSDRALWYARDKLGLPNATTKPPANEDASTQTRTELLLAWLKARRTSAPGRIPPFTNTEAALAMDIGDMSKFGRAHGNIQSRLDFACYRLGLPPLGLTAKEGFSCAWKWGRPGWEYPDAAMQRAAQVHAWSDDEFERILQASQTLPGGAGKLWKDEAAANPEGIKSWAEGLGTAQEGPFWVFVCNPQKWAIDEFLARSIEVDSWGVRPTDRDKFKPGQLGIIRVGQDRRTKAERGGRSQLESGIYAICEVLTEAYDATGPIDEFWSPGSEREPGWPTVGIRYLRTFLDKSLPITRLREELPAVSHLLLDGFQGSTFPISGNDFRAVTALMGVRSDELPEAGDASGLARVLQDIEDKYKDALPEVKERQSRSIERGPVGAKVKKFNAFKCQVCDALGRNPHAFKKPNGEPYVEAHHVMPVANLERGSLNAANIMTVCANHHRQLHFGGIDVSTTDSHFKLELDGKQLSIPKPML
ncbi:EVE domain-containing protein [Acidiphilium sp. JA12-A1]|uniref:EVE domain-containing protein n=1 Tax=Acidiphilium sp. JA12-A1 TaxID=1464546 RepID=UPI0004615B21|nr:EVE domain-containing protein [Acidiphilium sp. JA12-A1]KDM68268.1 putative restriction endonuclease [Acidiphilium sp. JA12-A1]